MPRIFNISLRDAELGNHPFSVKNTIMIRIVDPDMYFSPMARDGQFVAVHKFKFLDIEFPFSDVLHSPEEIQDKDAVKLAGILKDSMAKGYDVVVHCVAGICRSGAVVEAGILLGFDDPKYYRAPNRLVASKLRKALGFTHSWEHDSGKRVFYPENRKFVDYFENGVSDYDIWTPQIEKMGKLNDSE